MLNTYPEKQGKLKTKGNDYYDDKTGNYRA